MDEATSGGWNASKKRKRFLIATVTEGYPSVPVVPIDPPRAIPLG